MSTTAATRRKKQGAQGIRRWMQIGFFILIALIVTSSGLKEEGITLPFQFDASIHAICPFGGVVSFWQLASFGTLVKKVHESSVVLAVIAIFLSVLFGPVICGWVCPMGSVQEWFGTLGRRLFKKRYNHFVPAKLDRILRYLRYLVFAWVTYMTIVTGKLAFNDIDPYAALFGFWRSEVAIGGVIILLATLALSLFVERPFCKYACPYGAFQGIFNLFRVFGIKRNPKTCVSCSACDKACPMNIEVSGTGRVRDHQCISCLQCTSEAACPKPATVELGVGAWKEIGGETAKEKAS